MALRETLADLNECADVVEALLGRPVTSMKDLDEAVAAFVARSRRNGLPPSDGLDSRIAMTATAAAAWRRSGGARFEVSESVAASLVLTREATVETRLPLPAFMVHLPRGYMPSRIDGEFEGTILVVDCGNGYMFASANTERGANTGTRIMFIPLDGDVEKATPVLDGPHGQSDLGQDGEPLVKSGQRIGRIVRNLAAWLEAFPPRDLHRRKGARMPPSESAFGETAKDGSIYHLRTFVKLDASMRQVAKQIVHGRSSAALKKLAMRHIVRGHWKRQAVGIGGQDRKAIYVAPYWRGPDAAVAWGRAYRLMN